MRLSGYRSHLQSSVAESKMTEEAFLTIKEAAKRLNLSYHQIQRATKKGLVPSYRPFGRRPLVRLSELVAVIEASKIGGQK